MFEALEPLRMLPVDIQRDFGAELESEAPTEAGIFRLVEVRRTAGMSAEGQRIKVLVIDENGFPLPNVSVAFAFSTAKPFILTANYRWIPPHPWAAVINRTGGGGETDLVLGPEGVIKAGQRGGVTVYVLESEYASDVVRGAGMLADHTGLHLTFQLRRTGVIPLSERLATIEKRIENLEGALLELYKDD